jgi:hypothetical protein
MDTYQFITSMSSTLAWPIAIVILGTLLRKPMSRLLPSLKRVSVANNLVQADFSEVVADAKIAVAHLPEAPQNPGANDAYAARKERLRNLATSDPKRAVWNAWNDIEMELDAVWERLGMKHSGVRGAEYTPYGRITYLMSTGYIDGADFRVLAYLEVPQQKLFDRDVDVTMEEALDYIEMAAKMKQRLAAITIA